MGNCSVRHREVRSVSNTSKTRAGLTIRGAPYQRKAGTLFSYAQPGYSLSGCTFLLPKKLTTLLVVSERQHSVVKNWQLIGIGGPLAARTPSHGTTGTVDNPALSKTPID